MEQPVKLFEAPEIGGIVEVEVTEPLPSTGVADSTYKIKGTVKIFGAIGSLPWVYAEVKRKEWYKPEVAEEVSYERGFPMPVSGEFSIDFRPEKAGDYEVTVVATPAPLSLPVIGVFPIVGRSDVMKVAISKAPPAAFRFSAVNVDGNPITLTDKNVDAKLLLDKTTADYLEIIPSFEWTGPRKDVVISIKAGYKRLLDFDPKTGAYTQSVTLPASFEVYEGSLEQPLKIPLTACGGLTDGAIEVVAKIPGEADYISHIWNVYATKLPPEKISFDLTRPTPSVFEPAPGTEITITCPVTSRCAIAVDARAKVIIYEGSLLPGHGTKLKEYDSGVFHIVPNESRNVVIRHMTVKGTIDRRDVEVEIYVGPQLVKQSEWDDIYYMGIPPEEVIDFGLTRPSVSPAEITPGTPITLTCSVTSACTKVQSVTAKVKIYEGSIYAGHGTLITTKTPPSFSIAPGQTYGITISHTAIAGTIDRRDVEVEIYVGGKLVKEDEWDDVYYVREIVLETLEVDITPSEGGYVTTDPPPEIGPSKWYDGSTGKFEYGERVRVTAHPNLGYKFDHWSDEIEGGVSYNNPAYVAGTMTEHKAVKAHFEKEVVPPVEGYTLTVSISPVDPRYSVAKSPNKPTYSEGEYVTLTASPAAEFDHWQGAATGRYATTTIVMDSDKQVVAVFKPAVPEIVTFSVGLTGFPPLTRYFLLYYWPEGQNWVSDEEWHGVNDVLAFYNVKPKGHFSCFCSRGFGDISEQYNSESFYAADGARYEYDIASGRVTRLY